MFKFGPSTSEPLRSRKPSKTPSFVVEEQAWCNNSYLNVPNKNEGTQPNPKLPKIQVSHDKNEERRRNRIKNLSVRKLGGALTRSLLGLVLKNEQQLL